MQIRGLKGFFFSLPGGYLGELLQWSDLISGLYLLGHDVTVISETSQLRQYVPISLSHTKNFTPTKMKEFADDSLLKVCPYG